MAEGERLGDAYFRLVCRCLSGTLHSCQLASVFWLLALSRASVSIKHITPNNSELGSQRRHSREQIEYSVHQIRRSHDGLDVDGVYSSFVICAV